MGGADRRATHALSTKVRQAERLLERNPLPEKPFEPWELQLELLDGRLPSLVVRLAGAVVELGRSVSARSSSSSTPASDLQTGAVRTGEDGSSGLCSGSSELSAGPGRWAAASSSA